MTRKQWDTRPPVKLIIPREVIQELEHEIARRLQQDYEAANEVIWNNAIALLVRLYQENQTMMAEWHVAARRLDRLYARCDERALMFKGDSKRQSILLHDIAEQIVGATDTYQAAVKALQIQNLPEHIEAESVIGARCLAAHHYIATKNPNELIEIAERTGGDYSVFDVVSAALERTGPKANANKMQAEGYLVRHLIERKAKSKGKKQIDLAMLLYDSLRDRVEPLTRVESLALEWFNHLADVTSETGDFRKRLTKEISKLMRSGQN